MKEEHGKLTALLSEPEDSRIKQLVDLINLNIKPPTPVSEDQVYIRVMYIVSDDINSYGGKFPPEELDKLLNLLVDSPVLVGHRKDSLPVGRNFHAELVDRDNRKWIKCYFYWVKSSDKEYDLKENIDSGIFKECSIGFTFMKPECSVCKRDIRTCSHEPFQADDQSGEKSICFFYYRDITKVLETSLVYRGAVADTAVSKDLKYAKNIYDNNIGENEKLESLENLCEKSRFLVIPYYEGIEISVGSEDGHPGLFDKNNNRLELECFDEPDLERYVGFKAVLIGFRGKERCSKQQLLKYIEKKSSVISRVELRIIPASDQKKRNDVELKSKNIKIINHRFASYDHLEIAIGDLLTKDGVLIKDIAGGKSTFFHYKTKDSNDRKFMDNGYTVLVSPETDAAYISLRTSNSNEIYKINRFDIHRFKKGARYLIDKLESPLSNLKQNNEKLRGNLLLTTKKDNAVIYHCDGYMAGQIKIQKVKLNGCLRELIAYRALV